jgi:methylphosphotriester-DNA--protein-cysteine methyltransferase
MSGKLARASARYAGLEGVNSSIWDEAKILLKTGQYQVGDVALWVGYEDLSSFSKAYKARFKVAPSNALPS